MRGHDDIGERPLHAALALGPLATHEQDARWASACDASTSGYPDDRRAALSTASARPGVAASAGIGLNYASFLCGAASGVATAVVVHPFDTIKVRLQTANVSAAAQRGPAATLFAAPPALSNLSLATLRSLYRGFFPQLGLQMVGKATLFGTQRNLYAALAAAAADKDAPGVSTREDLLMHAVAGSGAGVAVGLVSCPLEVVKCRLQALERADPTATQRSLAGRLRTLAPSLTVRRLYQGLAPTLMRSSIGNFAFFGTYRALTAAGNLPDGLPPEQTVAAGAVAGCMFWTAGYPFDLVKTQQQVWTGAGGSGGAAETARPEGPPSVARLLAQNARAHGVARGLYRGLGVTLVRAVPSNAAAWLVFDTLSRRVNGAAAAAG